MARFYKARGVPRGLKVIVPCGLAFVLLVSLASLWNGRLSGQTEHGLVPESVPILNTVASSHARSVTRRVVTNDVPTQAPTKATTGTPTQSPVSKVPTAAPTVTLSQAAPVAAIDVPTETPKNQSKPHSANFNTSNRMFDWDYNETKIYRPIGANTSRVAEHGPLTWEAIDFITNLTKPDTMQTFYEGALNPPVWHRTNWTHAIFYDVYDSDASDASDLDVIKEQVGQMAYAAPTNVVTPVYYSLGGPKSAQYQAQIKQFFARYPSLSPHLLQQQDGVLNSVRDYCVQQAESVRTRTRVTYLSTGYNHHRRRVLTAGALHPDCLQPLDPSTNICGLQFYTRPIVSFLGNMWTARCDLMAKLLPLAEHEPQTKKVREAARLMQFRRKVIMTMTKWTAPDCITWYENMNFVSNVWIGAHPDLVPTDVGQWCDDVSRIQFGNHRYTDLRGSTGLRCRGYILPECYNGTAMLAYLSEHTGERMRDFFSFPGMILRWFTFYGRGPPDSSPIWTWFTDGDVWKEAVREHGISAVSMVTDKYALEEIGRTSWTAFSNRTANGSAVLPHGLSTVSKVTKVPKEPIVFFHVVLPLNVDPFYQTTIAALSNQLQLIAEALQYATWKKTPIYYTLATRNSGIVLGAKDVVQTTCKTHALDCIPLGDTVVDTDFAGETLWYAHQHCSVNPTSAITYLSNVIPNQFGSLNATELEQLILDITLGALNKACWRLSTTTCSTCGLTFRKMPFHLQYEGNMFSARCYYINKLTPPVQFEPKMNQLAEMFTTAADTTHMGYTDSLESYIAAQSYFGTDHFATEHWIGSDPSILPCYLAGDSTAMSLIHI